MHTFTITSSIAIKVCDSEKLLVHFKNSKNMNEKNSIIARELKLRTGAVLT